MEGSQAPRRKTTEYPILNNPDHDVEWEMVCLIIGAAIGLALLVGSFVQLALWYWH
jgi:hypothetical protein